jgi:uncharacterized RDD family membrane protein YckC
MEIWIGRDGERHGPYKEEDIRAWLRSGELSRDDLGWREGLADWRPLSVLFPEETANPPPFPASTMTAGAANERALTDYAGFWKRVLAYILDALVLWIPNLLLGALLGERAAQAALQQAQLQAGNDPQLMLQAMQAYLHAAAPAILAQMVLSWLYFALCESSAWQATVGKRALGLRVTDLAGRRIGFGKASGRYFAKLLSAFILGIGFLMVAWTRRKQGLNDFLADTLVLNGRAGEARDPARLDA